MALLGYSYDTQGFIAISSRWVAVSGYQGVRML